MGGFFSSIGKLFSGTPEKRENVSSLRPGQEKGYKQLLAAAQGKNAGGAFGTAANYYKNLLSNDSADYNAFAAPMMRQYNEDIAPDISEQFAGMGSGGLTSSGFMNAQTQGGVDLAERLGAMRANLRQSGVQGLQNIGNLGLGSYGQNMVTQQGTQGLGAQLAPIAGMALGTAIGGPAGGMIGAGLGSAVGSGMGYGGTGQAGAPSGSPSWMGGMRGGHYPYNPNDVMSSSASSSPRASPTIPPAPTKNFNFPSFGEGIGRRF